MKKIRLGRTELQVTKTSFGALPIQRIDSDSAGMILRRAYEAGINYFDTARAYTDSEEKIGRALADVRHNIVISTKTGAVQASMVEKQLEESLHMLKTDYIDIYQLHNPAELPNDGVMEVLQKAKKQGKIRFIGITNHRLNVANSAVDTGLFDTLQFPFSCLSGDKDIELVEKCAKADMGFIAMKALSGGLITNVAATFAYIAQFDNVVPIYGIQHMWELEQFLKLDAEPPKLDAEMMSVIEHDRRELAGNFCRSCGYCMPCPAGIQIPNSARMTFLMGRSPYKPYITRQWRDNMHKINDCLNCGQCKSKCPYGLDTPALLKKMLADYDAFLESHKDEITD